ncbi:MAG TPA: serine/threonine-protein kinase [Polyangia bacterium]|nr:serine/threonine-protein kinase [Polyangia bacterium]
MQRSPIGPAGFEGSATEPRGCLDEQEVVDFAGGLLPADRMASVEAHLGGCARCTALVAAAAPHMEGAAATSPASPAPVTHTGETQPISPADMPRFGQNRERPRLPPGTPLDSTYQVVRFLGRGGMGDVYEVKHARLAGRYAAKLLSIDLADNKVAFSRFQREAMIASGLSHPNIVNVIDFCHLPDGLPCLVMEYLDGVDLGDLMARGPMSLVRTLRLVRQIVSALGTLHGLQIIHRDLKPQNIFVLPESEGQPERVKLVDFGLAKRSNPSMVVTHDRTLLGTPQYMAPEQAIGSADSVGPEADQFSLAAIVYEMLAGRHPFVGEVLSTVLYRIVHESPAPLATVAPDLPPYVGAALERALSKERQARFPSVKAFLQALEGEGSDMMPAPIESKQRRSWFVRREVLASVGVLAVTAGIVGAFRLVRPDRGADHGPLLMRGGREGAGPAGGGAAPAGLPTAPSERRDRSALSVEPRPAIASPRALEIHTADKARPAPAAPDAPAAASAAKKSPRRDGAANAADKAAAGKSAPPKHAVNVTDSAGAAASPASPEPTAAAPPSPGAREGAPPPVPAPVEPKPPAPLLIEKL